ncbi:hypothetical protein CDAR_600021 [Caerostris darwini]|uniref:Uncharacterized protein n=1 Tax=Caerostris darwini TaxID=1538125 RepID=A0AAV4T9L5_9ARAC|nr:hypothetical protein CDAR_600021 [Caerostris darwini]
MVIRNCEFCKAYVADFEVHTCRIFGNQQRQSSATLPRSSSNDIDQDNNLRTQQMHFEVRIPSIVQTHASGQHSILPNMRQITECEDTAAAEVSSQFGVANRNPYNPETSDFLFPGMAYGGKNQTESAYSLQLSEDNSVLINQNPQLCEAWNPNPDVHAPLPVAEPCFLSGFQQTFGQRNPWKNQLSNESSQVGCYGASRSDENSHYVSGFNESDNISINQLSQRDETTLRIPILAVQNAQYNPMNPIPPTDAVGPIQSIPINVQKNVYRMITSNLKIVLVVMRGDIPAVFVIKHFLPVGT